MQECWSQSLVRASYCCFSSSSSLLSSRSFCVDGQSACLSTSRQLHGDRHLLPFPTVPACPVPIPYCPHKHLSLVPFCVHQHTAAGRKTRLDIQNNIMVATAIYSVTMVLWKETGFPLCRAMERRWKRKVVCVNILLYYYYYFSYPR